MKSKRKNGASKQSVRAELGGNHAMREKWALAVKMQNNGWAPKRSPVPAFPTDTTDQKEAHTPLRQRPEDGSPLWRSTSLIGACR